MDEKKRVIKKYFRTATQTARLQKASGWNQAELADKLGVNRSTISKWITGYSKPTGEKKEMIIKLLAEFNRVK